MGACTFSSTTSEICGTRHFHGRSDHSGAYLSTCTCTPSKAKLAEQINQTSPTRPGQHLRPKARPPRYPPSPPRPSQCADPGASDSAPTRPTPTHSRLHPRPLTRGPGHLAPPVPTPPSRPSPSGLPVITLAPAPPSPRRPAHRSAPPEADTWTPVQTSSPVVPPDAPAGQHLSTQPTTERHVDRELLRAHGRRTRG